MVTISRCACRSPHISVLYLILRSPELETQLSFSDHACPFVCLFVGLSFCLQTFYNIDFFLQNYWTNFNYFFCKNIQRKILFSKINRPEKPYVVKEHSQEVNIQVCTNPDTPWYVGGQWGGGRGGERQFYLVIYTEKS